MPKPSAPALAILISMLAFSAAPPATAAPEDVRSAQRLPASAATAPPVVSRSLHNDTSRPFRELAAASLAQPRPALPARVAGFEPGEVPIYEPPRPASVSPGPRAPVQGAAAAVAPDAPALIVSFDGIGSAHNAALYGCNVEINCPVPPDTVGDVGPNHYVQMVNLAIAVYNKSTGATMLGPVKTSSLWSGFGGLCSTNDNGDPIVLYDHLAGRWLVSQFAFDFDGSGNPVAPYHECIAISQTGDPTGAWHRYDFVVHMTKLNDYPKFGVWPDAYYMSANQFSPAFAGVGVWAFNRSQMLNGLAATFVYFDRFAADGNSFSFLPADLDGPAPPLGAPNYFVEVRDDGFQGVGGNVATDRVNIYEFHVDFAVPGNSTFTGPLVLNTSPFDQVLCNFLRNCIPQLGTAATLDALTRRPMFRAAYRNYGAWQTIVLNHTVDALAGVPPNEQAAPRWYELRKTGANPWAIRQQGTYAPDGNHRWMGSIATDQYGHVALGYSESSSAMFPAISYAGRIYNDPLNTFGQAESTLIAGGGAQTSTSSRWGDYSAMSVDPADDCTFWYTNQYYVANSNRDWHTRIGSFKYPNCGVKGDVNNTAATNPTNPVTILDAQLTAQCALDLIDCNTIIPLAGNVNCDNLIPSIADAQLIAKKVLDLIASFPC